MEHVSMFPVDTVKTRMQASQGRLGVNAAVRAVLSDKGIWGFIRGAHVMGFGCIPSHIGLFGIYEYSMAKLVDKEEFQPHRIALCGAMAAVFHDSVLTPHDMVKQRLQMGHYSGALHCIESVYRTEGPCAFYRGLPAALAMNVPYTAAVTAMNESLRRIFDPLDGGDSTAFSTITGYFLCAGFSGAVAAALTSPFDVLRTRLQTQRDQGLVALITRTFEKDGIRGFFRGTVPRICLAAPAAAVSWGTYETIRLGLMRWSERTLVAKEVDGHARSKTKLQRTPSISVRIQGEQLLGRPAFDL
jgi:solute carrier family 25 iron transporter 28/37